MASSGGGGSSFVKRGADKAAKPRLPPGTRPSLHNNTLLVSSGVPSLDSLLGGGIAVGTVVLIGQNNERKREKKGKQGKQGKRKRKKWLCGMAMVMMVMMAMVQKGR
jgi:hypothetical protein